VKLAALLLLGSSLTLLAQREGNFVIRFEPKAILQTGVPVPFEIDVNDDLGKPLTEAKVTLQIDTADHKDVKVFKAPAVSPGVYIAKPVFSSAGQWNVYVEVRHDDRMSARTIQFNVAEPQP
jgi:uncharacterized GH25 family protein